jgi:hypothetical protein
VVEAGLGENMRKEGDYGVLVLSASQVGYHPAILCPLPRETGGEGLRHHLPRWSDQGYPCVIAARLYPQNKLAARSEDPTVPPKGV